VSLTPREASTSPSKGGQLSEVERTFPLDVDARPPQCQKDFSGLPKATPFQEHQKHRAKWCYSDPILDVGYACKHDSDEINCALEAWIGLPPRRVTSPTMMRNALHNTTTGKWQSLRT
jgi:hypothetical protein